MRWQFWAPLFLGLSANTVLAQENWLLAGERVLAFDSPEGSATRLEISVTESCQSIELRLWAELGRSKASTKSMGDELDLAFFLADATISSKGILLDVYPGFTPVSDLAHIRLGYWEWDVIDHLPNYPEQTKFSLSAEGTVLVSSSRWPLADLAERLEMLRLTCETRDVSILV